MNAGQCVEEKGKAGECIIESATRSSERYTGAPVVKRFVKLNEAAVNFETLFFCIMQSVLLFLNTVYLGQQQKHVYR